MHRRQLLAQAAALPWLALAPWRAARAAVVDESWHDPRRDRHLPLRIRWPEGSAPCALIVHSHGLGGNRGGGDVWGEAWRRAGLAVLHVQHPGSDTEVLREGMVALRRAASGEQLRERVADVQFLIDEVERRARANEAAWARVRLDALGLSGHSFGAHTVQAIAGQRFPVAAQGVADARFKAFVALSPAPGQAANAFAGVTRPFLALTGTHDDDPLRNTMSGADRARVYDSLPPGRRALLWLEGADHMSLGGNSEAGRRARGRERSAAAAEARHQALISDVTTLWWRAYLLGDAAALDLLRSPAGLGEGDRWRMD